MVLTATKRYTAEDLWAMPGDEPWEIWDGDLTKVPGSGLEASEIAGNVFLAIKLFVRERGLGVVTTTDGSYDLSRDPDTIVVPDVAVIRRDRLPEGPTTAKYGPVPPDGGDVLPGLAIPVAEIFATD